MNRTDILDTAKALTTGDRNKTYGEPRVNLGFYADLCNAYLSGIADVRGPDHFLTSTDAAILMALAKISRIIVNSKHADNYIDGACYLAIAGECAGVQGQ